MIPFWHVPVFAAGGMTVSSYFTLSAAGIAVGHFGLMWRARRMGLSTDAAAVFSASLIVAGVLGAILFRPVYSAQLRALLLAEPRLLFQTYPGFASFGGIAGGLLGGWLALRVLRVAREDKLRFLDALAFVFPVAFAFGRLGCSLNHDHPGIRTANWLGVRYPDATRYDLGLLEFLFLLLVLVPAQAFLAPKLKRPGMLFAFFTVSYGVFRFALDQLHIDPPRVYGVTVDQWSSIALVLTGVAVGARAGSVKGMITRATLAVFLGVGMARGQSLEVKSHTLENGMKVIVHEDHDLPNVALYFFFKIGSRNERPGTTGLSHFFEHMMFNGAKKYGPNQFDIQMEKSGGANNAYTTQDMTVYTDWFAKSALELMFDMEADRIRDLAIDPKIVESERGVVYSERRLRTDNSNIGALHEQVNAATFTAHPYGWPVVGWPSDIEGWTLDDLKAHFKMGYAPNNCVMVITGDVTDSEAMTLAKKYLEPIPKQEPPPPVRTVEPEQKGERRVIVEKAAQAQLWLASYHTVRSSDADYWPMEALGRVLATGRSSRLHQRLVEKEQLALSVRAGIGESMDPGTFDVTMQLRPGADVAKAEAALDEELARVAKDGIEAQELEKARNQMRTELFRELSTIAGKANLLGRWEVFFGGHEKLAGADGILQGLTVEQVKAAAAKYVKKSNRTVGVLVPVKREAGK